MSALWSGLLHLLIHHSASNSTIELQNNKHLWDILFSLELNEPAAGASMEETSNEVDQRRRQPHGSVGAAAGQRAIGQSNSAEIAEAFFRYSAPEESDTASVRVPELDLELASGTLGGIVAIVEGLITKISESLERVHGFTFGES